MPPPPPHVECYYVHGLISWLFSYLGNDWVNPDDLTALAEMELLGAANSIEAAAKKLSQLQPRPQPQVNYRLVHKL